MIPLRDVFGGQSDGQSRREACAKAAVATVRGSVAVATVGGSVGPVRVAHNV